MPLVDKAETSVPTSGPSLGSIDDVIPANHLQAQHIQSQNG